MFAYAVIFCSGWWINSALTATFDFVVLRNSSITSGTNWYSGH